jgi:hypothetical protein
MKWDDRPAKEREALIYRRLARRAGRGLPVPAGFIECVAAFGKFLADRKAAFDAGERLAALIESPESGRQDLEDFLHENPRAVLSLAIRDHARIVDARRKASQSASGLRKEKDWTAEKLAGHRDRHAKAHGTSRGWRKSAEAVSGLTGSTIARRLKATK